LSEHLNDQTARRLSNGNLLSQSRSSDALELSTMSPPLSPTHHGSTIINNSSTDGYEFAHQHQLPSTASSHIDDTNGTTSNLDGTDA
jgi:hypothetical protein